MEKNRLSKTFKKSNFDFLKPISFYGNCYEKQKGSGASSQSIFRLLNMFRSFLSLGMDHLTILALIQGNSRVIRRTKTCDSCKPFHDAIIIPFSTSSLNLKTLDKKEDNYKNLNISRAN